MPELLIGCGRSKIKLLGADWTRDWKALTTLDINPDHQPDVVWDLNDIPLPFEDNTFDEIHAYEVLEHIGRQGDYKFFFAQFTDFWRILKPNGYMFGSCPDLSSPWLWGDPSHTRVISKGSLTFLNQKAYTQVGNTSMSDFRYLYQADLRLVFEETKDSSWFFALQAIKPSRHNKKAGG